MVANCMHADHDTRMQRTPQHTTPTPTDYCHQVALAFLWWAKSTDQRLVDLDTHDGRELAHQFVGLGVQGGTV